MEKHLEIRPIRRRPHDMVVSIALPIQFAEFGSVRVNDVWLKCRVIRNVALLGGFGLVHPNLPTHLNSFEWEHPPTFDQHTRYTHRFAVRLWCLSIHGHCKKAAANRRIFHNQKIRDRQPPAAARRRHCLCGTSIRASFSSQAPYEPKVWATATAFK